MIDSALFDPTVLVVLVGATVLGAVLRSGYHDCMHAVHLVAMRPSRRFNAANVKACLASYVRELRDFGVLRADPHPTNDPEIDAATATLARTRSVDALIAEVETYRSERLAQGERAREAFFQAAELASVMGLAGTLLALSQLAGGTQDGDFAAAIGTAVSTTLFGLLLGNLVFMPLAGLAERNMQRIDKERQKVIDWLSKEASSAARDRSAAIIAPSASDDPSKIADISTARRAS